MKIKELINYQNKHTKTELVTDLHNKALAKLTLVNHAYQQNQIYALIDNNTITPMIMNKSVSMN